MANFERHEYCCQIGIALSLIAGSLFSWNSAFAQVVPDGTLGGESSIISPNVDIKGLPSDRIDGGAARGSSLFHSFEELNVREGRGAYFSNPAGIENIFSRVTGKNASNIFGTLGVLGNANLFLLNPNGIIFGPNSRLDVGGSFFGSTANSLNFADGEFSATNAGAPPLLTMKVPLGVQFGPGQPSAIVNSGNLSVGNGQNLTLTGGTVASTGDLSAPQGQVAVASVSSQSLVNINSSGQLVNITTPSSVSGENSLSVSLAEFLVNVDEKARPGLTVSNGQVKGSLNFFRGEKLSRVAVKLADSDLSIENGDVVAKNITAQTATLTAKNNLILVESLLGANGDLNLLAGNTVQVRDSANNPFIAQAGGKLLVQGKQGVDIFALNHPSSGLVSGGDMVLRSGNTVGGDARYWAGGNFRIEELDESLGGLFSPYDPVIRASGDVSFESYEGASLHIFAGGSVTIDGNIEITGADGTNGLIENNIPLSDERSINIDGQNSPTLDIRAGVRADAIGTIGTEGNLNGDNNITPDIPQTTDRGTSADIRIGGTVSNLSGEETNSGQILLTNQYEQNSLQGSIETGGITTYGNMTIDSRGDITVNGGSFGNRENVGIDTSIDERTISNRNGGDIRLIADGNINIGGDLLSQVRQGGEIGDGLAGDITLKAGGNIEVNNNNSGNTVNINSQSNNDDADGDFGRITLESTEGSVILDRAELNTTNIGTGFAGDIEINGRDIQITDSSRIDSLGDIGTITIGDENTSGVTITNSNLNTTNNNNNNNSVAGDIEINGRDIQITDNSRIDSEGNIGTITIGDENTSGVIITNSNLSTTNNNNNSVAGDIEINGREIEITDTSTARRNTTIESQGDSGRIFIGVINNPNPNEADTVTADKVTITNSILRVDNVGNETSGNIDIKANPQNGSISLINAQLQAQTSGTGDAGNIIIDANNITFDGSTAFATVEPRGTGKGGNININATGSLLITNNNAGLQALVRGEQPNRVAGNISIITDDLKIENGAEVTVESPKGQAGNVEIRADTIDLDNGQISAETGQNNDENVGGNIILLGKNTTDEQVETLKNQISQGEAEGDNLPGTRLDHLVLGNESLIQANARGEADGGNIAIKTRLLLALPPQERQGNDISANAENGSGGQVLIDTRPLGAYNIEVRDIPTSESSENRKNDITATSETGVSGFVDLTLPDIDVTRGLLELPENLDDSSELITELCPVGTTQAGSKFFETGRGGLQASPNSPLSSDVLIGSTATNASPRKSPDAQRSSSGSTLVEAKGIKIGPKGEIILTANPSKPTSDDNSWQRNRGCNVR